MPRRTNVGDEHPGHIPSRGRCHLYVLPCAWEDLCKLGFSRDPLARMEALHPRFFELFDLGRGMLVETDTVAEARAFETRLRRELVAHNAPAPLTIRGQAGGHREWYRGAAVLLATATDALAAQGYRVHAPLRPWLRDALLQRSDRLNSWTESMLSPDELQGLAGWTPAQQRVRDALDAWTAMELDVVPFLPPTVRGWHRRVSGT